MGIDGLIVLDNAGRPIIQSGFRSTSPAYPLLHIDAFNEALANADRPEDIDPVIRVAHYTDTPSACCHVVCEDLRLLCPISGNVDPLSGFAFLQTFIDILQEYFGSLSSITLKENFDVVYQLLEETLDSGGHPLTTSQNALRDIVLPPSLLSKLLNAAGANLTTLGSSSSHGIQAGPFSSPIPWRKSGLKYGSNEIYFDMVEELRAIVNKHGVPLTSSVYGKIETNCRLSGTPDCLLSLANPHVLTECAFHPCVRLQQWTRDKSLSFVPPDGRFILAEYRFSSNATANSAARFAATSASAELSAAKDTVPVPFSLKINYDIEESSASFNVTFTSRLSTRPIENVLVEFDLGDGAHAIKCIPSRESGGMGRGLSSLETGMASSSSASWAFDSKKKLLRWEIQSVLPSTSWSLQGSFAASTGPPRPSRVLQIHFEIQSYTFSALKVEQLKVTGELYKPYKGVRGRSSGNIEWRW